MATATQQDQWVLLDTKGAANFLRLHPQTLWKMRRDGTGPAYIRFGRSVRYVREDLITYACEQREGGSRG